LAKNIAANPSVRLKLNRRWHDGSAKLDRLLVCGEQIGMNAEDAGDPIDVTAVATDVYFGGPGDEIDGITIAPFGERFTGVFGDGSVGTGVVPARGRETLEYVDGGEGPNTTETGRFDVSG
jgi:hypothetical protein